MRIIYMYHSRDPLHGSILPGSLPNPKHAFKGYVPLCLTQRTQYDEQRSYEFIVQNTNTDRPIINTMELRNQDVELPQDADESKYWCKVFELNDFRQKQHLIKVRTSPPLEISSIGKFLIFFFIFFSSMNQYLIHQNLRNICNK